MSVGSTYQNSIYIGLNIHNILYGIELLLYFRTLQALLTDRGAHKKSNIFYALFSSMMVFLITVWVTTQATFGGKMWLLESDYPGGPNAYWRHNFSDWYMNWGSTAVIALQLMTDALMIHRCRIIWNSYRAIFVPVILWLASLGLGFLLDWTTSLPGGVFSASVGLEIGLAYYTVSALLNATLTCMICYRLIHHARIIQENLGQEHASLYFALTTMIVESVFPYTLSGIAFLVSYGMGSPISIVFASVYIPMMCISPQILILRVIIGSAWDNDTTKRQRSTLRFNPESSTTSDRRVHVQTLSNVYFPDGHNRV